MRGTRRLGQTVAGDTAQHILYGGLQCDAVTDGDIERSHTAAATQYRTNHLPFIIQGLPRSLIFRQGSMGPQQTALGHTDRR